MYLKRFDEFKVYTDPGSVNQLCRDFLAKGAGEAKDLSMGICEITGPGQVCEDAHSTWTQYFVVLRGEGTLYYNGKPHPVAANMVVEIPKNTRHYVRCEQGQAIAYLFINRHDK